MKRKKISLFVFVDALGWELVSKKGFLNKELPVRNSVEMQFGYSCTAIPTIFTGKKPREHGHFSYFYYDPKNSPFSKIPWWILDLLPQKVSNSWRMRRYISLLIKKLFRFTGYFQLYYMPFKKISKFNYCEKKDLFLPNAMGEVKNIFDCLVENNVNYFVSDWRKDDQSNLSDFLQELDSNSDTEFSFLYFSELDGIQHNYTKDGDATADKLNWYEENFRKLMSKLHKKYEEVDIAIFSDHGMTSLKGEIDLKQELKEHGLIEGRDYVSCLDSTMGRFWFDEGMDKQLFKEVLKGVSGPGRILTENELQEFGANFNNNKYGEVIYLLEPGYQLVPSDLGNIALNGMHGYDPSDCDSDACFLANFEPKERPKWVGDFFGIMKESFGG